MMMKLVVAIVVAAALQYAHGQAPTSIQFRFLAPVPTATASEPEDAVTRVDVGLPIRLELEPVTAILQDNIVVSVSGTSGTATRATDCPNTSPLPPFNGDFCFVTNDVTFDIGANHLNTITVVADVFDDRIVEGTESFTTTASITDPGIQPGGVIPAFVPGTNTVTVTLADDDVPFIRFTQPAYTQNEDISPLSVSLVLDPFGGGGSGSSSISQAIVCQIVASVQPGDTATEGVGGDFLGTTCLTTFIAGSGPGTLATPACDITINNDNIAELDETFSLTATIQSSNGLPAQFSAGGDTASATITEVIFRFSPTTYTVAEDVAGGQQVVSLELVSGTLSTNIGIQVTVTGGTATLNADFSGPNPGVVTFLAGDGPGTSRSTVFTIVNDGIVEPDETILISGTSLSALGEFQAGGDTASITITSVEPVILHLQSNFIPVTEGTPTVAVCVVADNPAAIGGRTIPVTISATPGSAQGGGVDYGPITCNPLVFSGTDALECCNIPINDDNLCEATESFTVSLSTTAPASDATLINPTQATVSITDNDFATFGIVSMDPVSGTVGPPNVQVPENGLNPLLCAQLQPAGGITLATTKTVTLATGTGTAAVTEDYAPISSQIVFTPLNQNQALCRTITVMDDLICEADESFPVTLTSTDNVILNPSLGSVTIIDDDVVTVGFDQSSYSVTEFQDSQLDFNVQILSGQKGPGRSCVVIISTLDSSATSPSDFTAFAPPMVRVLTDGSPSTQLSVSITEDLIFEPTEHFNLSISTTSDGCTIPDPIVDVYIMDDEDCIDETGPPCDENAECIEFPGINNFTCRCLPMFVGDGFDCRPERMIGDDPHFSIVLPSGKLLCYTVQGEHGFVFNLISNRKLSMNAMFVPDSRREEVTWLGSIGIVVWNSGYKMSNATYLRFETKGKKIYIGDKVVLEAKNIEKLSFNNGKLTISEAPPAEGFKYPSVEIDLRDVGLNFTIKFMNEHLDLFWHSTGHETKDSHGLIGQFFRKEVEIDTVRKILILPGKEPVPVMSRPVWSFMEREVADDQLCWTAMNPGYQGQGLIDGTYLDYLVNDVFSTDFKFKKRQ